MRELNCLRCGSPMEHARREKIQLGQTGWFLGGFPNLLAGALELDMYCCPECGKIEFFQPDYDASEECLSPEDLRTPQKKCPRCGKTHDFDYPKCPFCKYDYGSEPE